MQVVLADKVMYVPPDIIFCNCSVDIANDQFIIVCIEVDLSIDTEVIQSVCNFVHSEVQF
jgi:hypothetical protein